MDNDVTQATRLLNRFSQGDQVAADELMPLIYTELKRLASAQMSHERADHTLQPTALVHEAFLQLIDAKGASFESRRQFYGMASKVMRNLILQYARKRNAERRGGGRLRVGLEDHGEWNADLDLISVNEVLELLALVNPGHARLVELRFFGGLSMPECAEVLEIPLRTAERRWRVASSWLEEKLKPLTGGDGS